MANPTTIKEIRAREILDSRGNPTVAVKVELENTVCGYASVPSGASTGAHEALELRDGDKKRYGGKGVLKAVANVNGLIKKELLGFDARRQRAVDDKMLALDGTDSKSRLGANAILGVSLAVARAAAAALNQPFYKYIRLVYSLPLADYRLPLPMMNILNGGAHANWSVDIQEYMIIPKQKKFFERVRAGSEIFHSLANILKIKGYGTAVGDEGGFAPKLPKNEAALSLIESATKAAGYTSGKNVMLAMDAAASEFYDEKTKKYALRRDKKRLSSDELLGVYARWMEKYPLISIEDPFAEDDWASWVKMTSKMGKKVQIVGDDLFVTNVKRFEKGIKLGAGNAILIKLNQIGTLSETIDAIMLAKKHDYRVVISHRSGETCDTTIADLAVAVNAEYIKTGSLSRSERVEKYNRLMKIEEELLA